MNGTALIPVEEAARRLGVSPDTLRAHLRAGAWTHLGASAAQNPGRTTWHYLIPRAGFERMLRGEIPVTQMTVTVSRALPDEEVVAEVLRHVSMAYMSRRAA